MSFLHYYPRSSYFVPFALLISTLQMDVDSGLTMNGRSWRMINSDAYTTKSCLYTWELVLISVNERWCQICYWSATCLVVCHIHFDGLSMLCSKIKCRRWNAIMFGAIYFVFIRSSFIGDRVSFMWCTVVWKQAGPYLLSVPCTT